MRESRLISFNSIPNVPFFYLVFRAWSHWRALSGSKHIEFLLDRKLVVPKTSKILDELYSSGKKLFEDKSSSRSTDSYPSNRNDSVEVMVLHKSDGKRIAAALKMPELDIELDRAVWQVERALQAEKELKQEKDDLQEATAQTQDKKS